ncbi:hypothetical protein KAW65_05545 [candidate division WOR-3 bacterium]|nr:hypothetical protein [candidate division WOR-3 bacterium]
MYTFPDFSQRYSKGAKKIENAPEGEILFKWEYEIPRGKKFMRSVSSVLLIGLFFAYNMLPDKWEKFTIPIFLLIFFVFISLGFLMRDFKYQEYALTSDGVYGLEFKKKKWQRLGYWKEFINYERIGNSIHLKKKGFFGGVRLHFNKSSENFFKTLTIVNENIFRSQ